jgi:hypothetical protein
VGKVIQFWSHHQTAFAIGAVVVLVFALLVLVLLVIRMGRRKSGEKIDRKLADDLAKGNHEAAAERELEAGHLRAACDLFVRARQPMRAAQIAVRLGCLPEAAELFEKAGSRRRAADLYNQAGMKMKAEELLAEEERVAREREEQKAALRKRLEAEPEEDVASLDRSPPPARLVPSASALGDVAAASRERELNPASAPTPETPSRVASPSPRVADHRARPSAASGGQGGGTEPRAGEPSHGSPASVFGIHALVNQAVELSFGDAKPAKSELLVDSPPPTPEPPAAIVEGLPEGAPRAARTTPRTPIPVVGASIGAYRMVRPSEPEVFTPPPSLRPAASEGAKSRLAQWPRSASGEHPSGERRLPTPTPRLALGTKLGTGESPSPPTRPPAGSAPPLPDGTAPRPATPPPVPRPGPQGTVVGSGPGRPGK